MNAYVLTPLARADIFEIWCYIADDNEEIADRVERAIYDACSFLSEAPKRGHLRRDITDRKVRFWSLTHYRSYIIVYRPDTVPIQIVAVLHGKRNIRRLVNQRI
jgi:plasmid stabilization system protein ParE